MSNINQFTGGATVVTSGIITIADTDRVYRLSVICISGTITVTGPSMFRGAASQAVTLSEGQSFTLTADGPGPIEGWIINGTGGSAGLVINQ